jgi:hypothetical protein
MRLVNPLSANTNARRIIILLRLMPDDFTHWPGCIPCKLYAGDTLTLTIDSIVICQTHAGDLRTFVHGMHPGSLDIV